MQCYRTLHIDRLIWWSWISWTWTILIYLSINRLSWMTSRSISNFMSLDRWASSVIFEVSSYSIMMALWKFIHSLWFMHSSTLSVFNMDDIVYYWRSWISRIECFRLSELSSQWTAKYNLLFQNNLILTFLFNLFPLFSPFFPIFLPTKDNNWDKFIINSISYTRFNQFLLCWWMHLMKYWSLLLMF